MNDLYYPPKLSKLEEYKQKLKEREIYTNSIVDTFIENGSGAPKHDKNGNLVTKRRKFLDEDFDNIVNDINVKNSSVQIQNNSNNNNLLNDNNTNLNPHLYQSFNNRKANININNNRNNNSSQNSNNINNNENNNSIQNLNKNNINNINNKDNNNIFNRRYSNRNIMNNNNLLNTLDLNQLINFL